MSTSTFTEQPGGLKSRIRARIDELLGKPMDALVLAYAARHGGKQPHQLLGRYDLIRLITMAAEGVTSEIVDCVLREGGVTETVADWIQDSTGEQGNTVKGVEEDEDELESCDARVVTVESGKFTLTLTAMGRPDYVYTMLDAWGKVLGGDFPSESRKIDFCMTKVEFDSVGNMKLDLEITGTPQGIADHLDSIDF